MTIACPSCGKTYNLPPEKAAIPNLTAKCRCGTVFAIAAAVVPPATAPVPPPPAMHAPIATATAEAPRPSPRRPPPWPRCANHPQVRSAHVCPQCVKGYCDACTQKVQGGAICGGCDGLCVPAAQYGQKQETASQRDRSMASYAGLIARYPFRDPLGFALLALFIWVFRLGNGYLAQGVLVLYAFHALTKVSNGDFKSFMPDSADLTQIFRPARLAAAAFVISSGPLMLVTLLVPGADLADVQGSLRQAADPVRRPPPAPAAELAAAVDDETEEGGAEADPDDAEDRAEETRVEQYSLAGGEEDGGLSGMAITLLALTFLWMVVYTPIALTVAALSHSFASTLNPVIGIDTIRRMGATYWHAMGIYTVLAGAQWVLGYGLDQIPIAAGIVRAFTDAYAWLAIACTLGLAVFKKATALGWD